MPELPFFSFCLIQMDTSSFHSMVKENAQSADELLPGGMNKDKVVRG